MTGFFFPRKLLQGRQRDGHKNGVWTWLFLFQGWCVSCALLSWRTQKVVIASLALVPCSLQSRPSQFSVTFSQVIDPGDQPLQTKSPAQLRTIGDSLLPPGGWRKRYTVPKDEGRRPNKSVNSSQGGGGAGGRRNAIGWMWSWEVRG